MWVGTTALRMHIEEERFVGLTEEEAVDLVRLSSLRYRVTKRIVGGVNDPIRVTLNIHPDRINLHIVEGFVTYAKYG